MKQSLSVTFAAGSAAEGRISASLVQENIPQNNATLGDLRQMIARAVSHRSAREYMLGCCPCAALKKNILTISVDIFVYPSTLDLDYLVRADWGVMSSPILDGQPCHFDVMFDGSDTVDLDYLFSGLLTPEMPFFDPAGSRILGQSWSMAGEQIKLSTPAYGVLRAAGVKIGYRHTIDMPIDLTGSVKVSDIRNNVTLTYIDGTGKLIVKKLLLQIPQCAQDLLAICDNGTPKISYTVEEPELSPVVYYSDCDGHVIALRYEE